MHPRSIIIIIIIIDDSSSSSGIERRRYTACPRRSCVSASPPSRRRRLRLIVIISSRRSGSGRAPHCAVRGLAAAVAPRRGHSQREHAEVRARRLRCRHTLSHLARTRTYVTRALCAAPAQSSLSRRPPSSPAKDRASAGRSRYPTVCCVIHVTRRLVICPHVHTSTRPHVTRHTSHITRHTL
jgi:hypothetical protein